MEPSRYKLDEVLSFNVPLHTAEQMGGMGLDEIDLKVVKFVMDQNKEKNRMPSSNEISDASGMNSYSISMLARSGVLSYFPASELKQRFFKHSHWTNKKVENSIEGPAGTRPGTLRYTLLYVAMFADESGDPVYRGIFK